MIFGFSMSQFPEKSFYPNETQTETFNEGTDMPPNQGYLKFIISKKATKIDKIFTIGLTVTTFYQIDDEDFANFCGLLRKHEL